jgi:hypothetical protein
MQVVYHMGAHCTDEDRILRCLLRNRAALAALGTVVPPPGRYRALIRETLVKARGVPADRAAQAALVEAIMDDDRCERLVMSHDGFLCIPQRVITDLGFYTMAGRKVVWLANLFPEAECEFHVALVNPATLIGPLIAQMRGASYATVMGDTDPMGLRWLPVVQAMRTALPEARLVVWCHEDAPLLWPDLLRGLAGVPEEQPLEGLLDLAESLMLPEGIARLRAYLAERPPATSAHRRRVHATFLEKFALPEAMELAVDLPGWTEDTVARVTATYDTDVALIAALPGVEFLHP